MTSLSKSFPVYRRCIARLGALGGFAVLASGCGVTRQLTLPEGDGGWPQDRRVQAVADPVVPELAAPQPNARLSLEETLRLARANSRKVAEARARLEMVRSQVGEARGRLLPTTTAGGRYTWYTDPLTNSIQLPPNVLPAGVQVSPITIREGDFGVYNATLTLPLDLNGSILASLSAAQAGYRGEQARLWATTLEQETAALRAYFHLLEAQRLRQVTVQSVALYQNQAATAAARFENGRVTKNDLLVAQVAFRNAEQQLAQRELAISQARRALNEVVGYPISAETDVEDVAIEPELPAADETVARVRAGNPLLISLVEERQRLEASASALRRSRLPQFYAGAAVDHNTADITSPQTLGSGFAGIAWDLGTDTRREAQIAQAEAAIEQNRASIDRQVRELESSVRNLRDAAAERLLALSTARHAVQQAEENLRIRQQQFDAGRAQSDDVLLAESLLSQQRAVLATALYQAHIRAAELRQLAGESSGPTTPPAR